MRRNLMAKAEIILIVLLACVPLLIRFPYRVNIFLSWEGAYRFSQGQLPFRDFGIPLGGMYWVIPGLFFKLLGPKLITLVKAQVFINIIAGLAFRSILRSLDVSKGIRFAAVLLFCISYSFFNFWPWYNHSVIVYELVCLAFLFRYMLNNYEDRRYGWIWLVCAGVFACFSFLTKQDGGGMTVLIAAVLLTCYCVYGRKWWPLLWYCGGFISILLLVIVIFGKAGFGYWFNHGQAPHTARVSAFEIADEFLGASQWIKFYFFLTLVLVFIRLRSWASVSENKPTVLLVLLTWGILGEAAIFQVTSYTPPDNNIFFHSFAFVCIFSLLAPLLPVNFDKPRFGVIMTFGILLWWSGTWWKYMQRVLVKVMPAREFRTVSPTGENIVNRATYMINKDSTTDIPMDQWVECGLPAFDRISMPKPTADGIARLMELVKTKGDSLKRGSDAGGGSDSVKGKGGSDLVQGKRESDPKAWADGGLCVLNMSELTPLATAIPYKLERNPELPLWFHLGVGMFNRQAAIYEDRIGKHYYDLILFEYVPTLNNFYPFRIRDSLKVHYRMVDSFMAPRRGETQGTIEVYVRPS